MHKIIIDTDPGVDDTMAIAYALAHPDIELLGLTTVFGNINIDYSTRNGQYVLDVLGAETVAVARGASIPSVQSPLPHADFVHGADGLGNVYPGSEPGKAAATAATLRADARHATIEPVDAADFIIQCARQFPGEVTLVAIGPLTNVAEAYRREPALPSLVAGLVIMGGTVDEPGNVSPVSEANFLNDPHAADALLAADWPTTIVGLDVTHRIMLTDSHLKQLDEQAGETGSLIWNSSRFYVDFYTQSGAAKDAEEPQCAMHDAAAVAYVLIPDAFTVVRGGARVIPDGMAIGQLALDRKGYAYAVPHWQDRPATSVCMAVESDRVREHFLQTIIKHHKR
ncbi:nucleoside hydrolase [Granulosicoccus antarcticus]|uniref:Pyrimidine-specific ribonucleoside hydrolase RihB n=1 Tax=Granulosicoccus antarcticus IMCC3135 TaxID=1192854 RepID=A0A2Z2NZR7_9GAMM|nr:nucleoside hydrolase [Granulosicoccus antarcticus]ASJ75451.1 Pyrimidine-specific ribonucleoside hydrolase RihB [Granulosicoccus antarcticus IMCC3135]